MPDAIFYPTGGGTGLIGMWKAFDELEAVGLIGSKRPRMYAVQAEGCAPMVRAFETGDEFAERWENPATVATGIRVPKAVGDFLILRAVRESGGAALAVSEEAILTAVADVARNDGFLLCPEGGAVLAGWRLARERGLVGKRRARPAVQLREREQIPAGGPVEAVDAGKGRSGHALSEDIQSPETSKPRQPKLPGFHVLPSFEFGSTRQEYTRITVVPADSCRGYDITGGESVDKPVRLGR